MAIDAMAKWNFGPLQSSSVQDHFKSPPGVLIPIPEKELWFQFSAGGGQIRTPATGSQSPLEVPTTAKSFAPAVLCG